jgi:DEAD/DEAH box helicase domain-containing protein
MDRASAKELIYDNAVYIHLGRQFLVRRLDIANRVCEVEAKTVEYWTDAVVKTDIHVLTEDEELDGCGRYRAVLGDVLVRNQAEKFKKLRFHTHENIGYGDIDLPAEEMQTRALMLVACEGSESDRILGGVDQAFAAAVLAGVARLIHTLAPAFLLCDQRDLGRAERIRDPHFRRPALYFYDRYPGGTGLAEGIARHLPQILEAAMARLATCPCHAGCPSCIGVDFSMSNGSAAPRGSTSAGNRGRSSALRLLSAWGGSHGHAEG